MNADESIEKLLSGLRDKIEEKEKYKNDLQLQTKISEIEEYLFNQTSLNAQLKKAYQNNDLVLVLGAGVSTSCNVPDWKKLINLLLASTLDKPSNSSFDYAGIFNLIHSPNSLIAARYVKKWFNDSIKFGNKVRELLYHSEVQTSPLLQKISELCIDQGKYKIDSVITYNYDDLLEKTIMRKSNSEFKFKSVYSDRTNEDTNDLHIFHVHGYLPKEEKLTNENRIVLGEDSYHEQYTFDNNWQNKIQRDKLKNKICLFIGVSLTDPNMRRLLDQTKDNSNSTKHFIIKKRDNYDGIMKKVKSFNDNHIFNVDQRIIALLDTGIYNFVLDQINLFEKEDALSLGINTLWVRDHDEISSILDKMTKITPSSDSKEENFFLF